MVSGSWLLVTGFANQEPTTSNQQLFLGAGCDLHFRGPQQFLAEPVAALKLGDHGVLLVVGGRFSRHRLVDVRIERLADRFDRLETELRQGVLELTVNQLDTLPQAGSVAFRVLEASQRTFE